MVYIISSYLFYFKKKCSLSNKNSIDFDKMPGGLQRMICVCTVFLGLFDRTLGINGLMFKFPKRKCLNGHNDVTMTCCVYMYV